MHWGPVEKRDLILGVVVPGVVLVPFLVLGLLGLAVTLLSRRPLPPEGRALVPLFVALGAMALVFLAAMTSVLWTGPAQVRRSRWRRVVTAALLAAGVLLTLVAVLAQVPSLIWALGDARQASSLLVLIPGLLVLLGPLLVGTKYFLALVRPGGP